MKSSSITPHNDNFLPENKSIYNNNDDEVNRDDDDDDDDNDGVASNNDDDDDGDASNNDEDDDEFDDFISSQWKDSVEIGLIVNYPLPCTNYLVNTFDNKLSTTTTSELKNDDDDNNKSHDDDGVVDVEVDFNKDPPPTAPPAPDPAPPTAPVSRLPSLILSTQLEERSIAPLFDGTQWAGTRVWKAAILALEYIIRLRLRRRNTKTNTTTTTTTTTTNKNNNNNNLVVSGSGSGGSSLLELGCGLGVPGMVWKQLLLHEQKQKQSSNGEGEEEEEYESSSRVVLTDRDSLLTQLEKNIENNFKSNNNTESNNNNNNNNNNIVAKTLDWSIDGITKLLNEEKNENGNGSFDICLNCDCVYEPLYGRKAWESLADVLIEIAKISPTTLLVTSVERRNQDNVEGFLNKLSMSGVIDKIECAVKDDTDPHHIIEIYITKGININ